MIPDTSGQDRPIAAPKARLPLRIAGGAAAGLALVRLAVWLFSGWRSSAVAANASRLRIAPVTQGTSLRDASVNGRVVAAISPTLYAPAAATVSVKISAGDAVKKGQVLAQLESPELANALRREQSSFEELKGEVSRQEFVAQKAKLTALREADQAEIERAAAQRVFERIEKAGGLGVVPRNDFEKAQDALKSAEIRGRHATEAAKLESSDIDLQLRTRRETAHPPEARFGRGAPARGRARAPRADGRPRRYVGGGRPHRGPGECTAHDARGPEPTGGRAGNSRDVRPGPRSRHEIRSHRRRHRSHGEARGHLSRSHPRPDARACASRAPSLPACGRANAWPRDS